MNRQVSLYVLLGVLVFGCSSHSPKTSENPSVSSARSLQKEEHIETRITELVRGGLKKAGIQGDIIQTATPYVRSHTKDKQLVGEIVYSAFEVACKEAGGDANLQASVYNISRVIYGVADKQRQHRTVWPTIEVNPPDPASHARLLMDTAEQERHEVTAYLGNACIIGGGAQVVLLAYPTRPSHVRPIRENDPAFYDRPELRRLYWFSLGSFADYASRVPQIRAELERRLTAMEAAYAPEYQAKLAKHQAEAEKERAAEADALARKQAAIDQARARFAAAATTPKSVGITVCSSDNRIAFVEQIAGERIKITVKGQANGAANFLFDPNLGSIQFSPLNSLIWDDSRFWGTCNIRLS